MKPIRVIITDDHPMVVTGLRNILERYGHIRVIASYHSGHELLKGLEQVQADVLLLDIQIPDKPGNELARIVSKNWPEIRILAVTSMDSSFHVIDMLQHGCTGYILKNTDEPALIRAIESVAEGDQYVDASLKEVLLEHMLKVRKQSNKNATLTNREKEVLQLIASEYSNQEIADRLNIAVRTAETHRFSIMQKMDVKNTVGLVRLALQMGLVK